MNLARRLLRIIVTSLTVFLLGVTLFQDRLLYFPETATVPEMLSVGLDPWPSAQDFRGLVAEPTGIVRATVVVFHGNAGHAGHRQFYAAALTPLGMRVILAEYPGYGPRLGALGEQSLVADAEQSIAMIHAQYGAPLLLVGESLGSGVVAAASVRQRDKVTGLLLITPWDNLTRVAAHHYPWLPISWLLRDRYESARHLAASTGPVAVALAERDTLVPARFGEALYELLPEPKKLFVIRNAEHNDWPLRIDDGWWRQAVDFMLGDRAPRPAAAPTATFSR